MKKTHCKIIPANFGDKNLEMMTNVFFISVKQKLNILSKKSFSVFGGAHGRPLNKLKLFVWQNVYNFFHVYEKYIGNNFKIFTLKLAGIM